MDITCAKWRRRHFVMAHDLSWLPAASNVRFTEDSRELRCGSDSTIVKEEEIA
jgi:hypothetical protein